MIGRSMATPDKEDGFGKYISLHCKIVKAVFDKKNRRGWFPRKKYLYIDTNAGSGDNGPLGEGSPVLFLKAVKEYRLEYQAHFIEREQANAESLRSITNDPRVIVHEGDNSELIKLIVPEIPKDIYGLAYHDPNGCPDLMLIGYIAENLKKVDIMIRVNAAAMKRTRIAWRDKDKPFLADIINGVKKENWIIREPLSNDKWQWIFLFGTNYTDWGAWKKERFYRVDSPKGQDILERLNYTTEELAQIRQPMFEMFNAVKERSGGICEVCLEKKATEVHHLRYDASHDPSKVLNICHECHCIKEGVLE